MRLVLALLFAAQLFAGSLSSQLEHLTPAQEKVLWKTYTLAQPHDLAWSMTAIAWQESHFGANVVSTTQDYGVFQINIDSFKRRYAEQLEVFPLSDESIIHILTTDYELGFFSAIAEIQFWRGVHKDNWRKVYASYNGGWAGNKQYAAQIVKRIAALKQYMKERHNE